MGRLYSQGLGITRSDTEAWFWFDLAAQRSTGPQRDRAEQARADAEKKLSAMDLAKLRERAKELMAARGEPGS
jgi:TPR repeat protein